jgi:hypothetical protein
MTTVMIMLLEEAVAYKLTIIMTIIRAISLRDEELLK